MAQRGNRPKHVAGVKSADEPQRPDPDVDADPNVEKPAGGGGMAKTSPKERKAAARTARQAEDDAIAASEGKDTLEDDFRTERVPGPGPLDTDAGCATTKQLETHDLKQSR
jgi:hypothetical protein